MTNATKTKKQTLPKEVTKLYKAILKAFHPWQVIQESPIFDKSADKLTEALCDWENLDFMVICAQDYYLFTRKDGVDWDISKVGRPYVLFSDETIRPELEKDIPEIHWVFIPEEQDLTKPETPFQKAFSDRLDTILQTAYDNL
jgi:hypothetical protein